LQKSNKGQKACKANFQIFKEGQNFENKGEGNLPVLMCLGISWMLCWLLCCSNVLFVLSFSWSVCVSQTY